MKNLLSTVLRAAAVAIVVSQPAGSSDLAFLAGAGARPALHPPPRAAALPRKAESRSSSLSRAAEWLARLLAPAAPLAPAPVERAPAELAPPPIPIPPEPLRDRILILRDPDIVGAAAWSARLDATLDIDQHPPIYQRRFHGPWIERPALRFRVNYLDTYGVTEGTEKGFKLLVSGSKPRFFEAEIPQAYRRSYPIYFRHDRVKTEVELENTGDAELREIGVSARQEALTTTGRPGCPIGAVLPVGSLKLLAPGKRAVLRYVFPLEGRGNARVNFEQTHLLITAGDRTLADEPQAGIVDPPNL